MAYFGIFGLGILASLGDLPFGLINKEDPSVEGVVTLVITAFFMSRWGLLDEKALPYALFLFLFSLFCFAKWLVIFLVRFTISKN